MQPDLRIFVQVGFGVWLALMGVLLYGGPAIGVTAPGTLRDLIGSATALALLIIASSYALWHDLTEKKP